ncbi:MAG: 6-carboxytetrahydropterin synthase [Phycisphaeraceae bacterium]|nr:6-carboxytetrahydropterin synthase [Phycisphaeraceae bacterium]
MYEVTIDRRFRARHTIRLYDGSWEPVHSHDWRVWVTVGAARLDRIGVVMDFHLLEGLLDAAVAQLKGRVLNDLPMFAAMGSGGSGGSGMARAISSRRKAASPPTAEHVARWIAGQLTPRLPAGRRLRLVRVEEAPGCLADYRPRS